MNRYDAVLVGAGIMSATLAVLLHELDPHMRILIVERLSTPGRESSAAENNAGTGHAANCELNYTPINKDGSLEIKKALEINSAFDLSLEFWASLASKGKLDPGSFLNQLPHISFVWGDQDVEYLQKRFQELKAYNAFKDMEFSSDRNELKEWIPLVIKGRDLDQKIAATRIRRGTDIDFGALTKAYLDPLTLDGFVDLRTNTEVIDLYRNKNSLWNLQLKNKDLSYEVESEFVFLGSGGGALPLLQKSGIPESLLYGGFPVSGQWLVCSSKELVDMHHAKVYGKAPLGSPPMSVPHLDTRWIGGQRSLLFGPFAGFSTKFLKEGSYLDLFKSIKTSNIVPIINVGTQNIDLINYLLRQLLLTGKDRLKELKAFFPEAKIRDWSLSIAGQRVQIIKNTPKGGILQMGTEVVTSTDGSLAALLGASPGASTAVKAMLKVLDKCWPEKMKAGGEWRRQIQEILPSICADYSENSKVIDELRKRSNSFLGLS